jgi:multidrug transporter EmrE-like cation transporter
MPNIAAAINQKGTGNSMSKWLPLLLCAAANIGANLALKQAVGGRALEFSWAALFAVLRDPFLWLGFVLAGIVLLSYLYAIRTLPVGLAYPMVTGMATLGTFFVGSLVFGDALTARAVGGVVLIAAGIILVSGTA